MSATRTCGSCRECCIHVPVAAFNKPRGVACEHLLPVISEAGCCGIYDMRPPECAAFTCSWLEGHLPDEMKPENCGMVFETCRIEWPKPLVLFSGFEDYPGKIAQFEKTLDTWLPPGHAAVIVPHDMGDIVVFAGTSEDADALAAFMQACREKGSVTCEYADGPVELQLDD